MNDTLDRYLAGVASVKDRLNLRAILAPIADRLSTQSLTSAGLVIGGTTKLTARTSASLVYYASVKGKILSKATSTEMATLVGTVTNAKFNFYAFFIDAAGTLTSAMGTEGTTYALATLPPFPEGKALVGLLGINPTGTGNFVGGTTALDDGTVTPNAIYISPVGPFDPSILL